MLPTGLYEQIKQHRPSDCLCAFHTDLYERMDIIPFDKIETFMKENLK